MSEGANGSAILAGNPAGNDAAGTNGGAAPAAPATPPAASSGAATGSPWLDSFDDADLRGYVENKGWSGPKDLADGYRNLEKLLGGEKIPMPKGPEDSDGWNRVYDALGRPKEATAYKIPTLDNADPNLVSQAQSKFHEIGLTEAQGNALAEWWNQQQVGTIQNITQQSAQQSEADLNSLKTEWGGAYDENLEYGRRAAREYGLDEAKLGKIEQAIGTGEMLKLFAQIGRAQSESKIDGGGQNNPFGMTPEAARQRITALREDAGFNTKYMSGDADARAEMDRLFKLAYPE